MDDKIPRTLRKFYRTFAGEDWNCVLRVPNDWQRELENYLVHGFPPGSFHTALFEGDLFTAARTSHPLNDWEAIRAVIYWLQDYAPASSYGSKRKVKAWLKLSDDERRSRCEKAGILATPWELLQEI